MMGTTATIKPTDGLAVELLGSNTRCRWHVPAICLLLLLAGSVAGAQDSPIPTEGTTIIGGPPCPGKTTPGTWTIIPKPDQFTPNRPACDGVWVGFEGDSYCWCRELNQPTNPVRLYLNAGVGYWYYWQTAASTPDWATYAPWHPLYGQAQTPPQPQPPPPPPPSDPPPLPSGAGLINFAWDASDTPNVSYLMAWGTTSGTYNQSKDFGPMLTGTVTGITSSVPYYFV